MPDVFISYSRKDSEFVQRIHEALVRRNRDVWVDWEDIPLTANWWKEITEGIEAADTFVFVLSPDSVASPICNLEVDHAMRYAKRIVPIMRREVDEADAFSSLARVKLNETVQEILADRDLLSVARQSWGALARHNWLFYDDDSLFDKTFDQLIGILDTDLAHLKLHTRLLIRALEWERFQRNSSFLLTGDEIDGAEQWLTTATAHDKSPSPTNLHQDYILESRQVENSRQRLLRNLRRASIVLGVIGVAAILATIAAVVSAQTASDSAATAQAQVMIAQNNIATSTAVIGTQQVDVAVARQAFNNANATLTPVLPTLTQAAHLIDAASTDVAQAQQVVREVNVTLTSIPPILTDVADTLNAASTQIGQAEEQRAISEAGVLTATVARGQAEAQQGTAIAQANAASTRIAAIGNELVTATLARGQALNQLMTVEANAQAAIHEAATAQAHAEAAQNIVATSTAVFGTQIAQVIDSQRQVADANSTLESIPVTVTAFANKILDLSGTATHLQIDLQDVANLSFGTVAAMYELEYLLSQENENFCPNRSLDLIIALAEQFDTCTQMERNTACLLQGSVSVNDSAGTRNISQLGQSVAISQIQTIAPSSASSDQFNSLGVVRLSVQANLPDTLPGQNVAFYLIGGVGQVPLSVIQYDRSLNNIRCNQIASSLLVQGPQPSTIDLTANGFEVRR